MDCKQVSKLSLLYCDNVISSHVSEELERHLKDCPECARLIDYTRREAEVLRYDGDVPVPGTAFTERVMESISKLNKSIPARESTGINKKMRALKPVYLLGSLAVCILLVVVLVPGVKDSTRVPGLLHVPKSQTSGQPVTATRKSVNSEIVKPLVKHAPSPDYKTFSKPVVKAKDNSARQGKSAPAETGVEPAPFTTGTFDLFTPAYIPVGFALTKSQHDSNNNNTMLTYENQTGAYFTIVVIPVNKTETAMNSVPLEVQNNSKTLSNMDNQQIRSMAGVTESATIGNSSSREQKITTIVVNIEREESPYHVEVSGNLSADELTRIASSIRSTE